MNRPTPLILILAVLVWRSAIRLLGIDSLPPLELKVAYPKLTFDRPITAVSPPSGDPRLYLVEQKGRILILPRDEELETVEVFLDITKRKPYIENEEGLLGFCFHPQFPSNGKFFKACTAGAIVYVM